MKFSNYSVLAQRGAVLPTVLVITGLIGFALAAYLTLIASQNTSTMRSQTWNSSIPTVEAGIEEALTHLNQNCNSNAINVGTVNWVADGWTAITGGYYKSNSLPDGSYYLVTLATTNAPTIDLYAEGYVQKPINISSGPQPIFAAAGSTATLGYLSRKVHATAVLDGLFSKGMVAKGDIGWVGNIWSDSFDSQDPSHSSSGQYDVTKRKDNGSVASVNGNVTMGGGVIYGSVATGPNGSATGGTVGDLAWIASGASGFETGHYANDMNVAFPDVQAPFSGGYSTPSSGTVSVTNYTYGTSQITSPTYPSPAPAGGVVTNRLTTVTSFVYPNPVPFDGVVTNASVQVTLTNYPSPVPAGMTTNITSITQTNVPSPVPAGGYTINTTAAHSQTRPSAGTYVGSIVTNVISTGPPSGRGTWYDYSNIVSYSYNVISYQYPTNSYTYTATFNYTYTGTTTNMAVTTSSYSYVLGTGNYQLSSLSLSGQAAMIVTGRAVLYVTGSTAMAGQAQIIIAPGASLKLYCGGSADLKGNGIMNNNSSPLNFQMYGLPGCTSIDLGGNAAFTGTMYAPEATFHAGGGGNNQYDCVGAVIVAAVNMNGHFTFHYDEATGRNGPARGYVLTSWNEY